MAFLQAVRCELLEREGCCFWCGCPLTMSWWATVDHEIPLSRGGTDDRENLLLSCRRCNKRRGDRLPWEFVIVHRKRGSGMVTWRQSIQAGLVARDDNPDC